VGVTTTASSARTVEAVTTEDPPPALVRTRGLTKRFRHAVVVDDVALEVPAGAV
jgi:ABC-type transporter Mla maintaining outer membrane lipid asymmetry ATPase subunit MlaF